MSVEQDIQIPTNLTSEHVDVHRHWEAAIFLDEVIEIFKSYEVYGIKVKDETYQFMRDRTQNIMDHYTPEMFFHLLNTRWIQFFVVKLMLEKPTLVSDFLSKLKTKSLSEALKADGEDLHFLNQLYCPRNVSADGELEDISEILLNRAMSEEERVTFEKWHNLSLDEKHDKGLTWVDVIKIMGSARNQFSQTLKEGGLNKEAFLTVSFRREKDFDFLTGSEEEIEARTDILQQLFKQGYFEMVDLCGFEQDDRYPHSMFAPFFEALARKEIQFSFHVGELPYNKRKLGEQNGQTAFSFDRSPLLFTHGNSFFYGNSPLETPRRMIKYGTVYALPPRSNIAAGLHNKRFILSPSLSVEYHRELINLFTDPQFEYFLYNLLLMITTDDPSVFSLERRLALTDEHNALEHSMDRMNQVKRARPMVPKRIVYQLLDSNVNLGVYQMKYKVAEARNGLLRVERAPVTVPPHAYPQLGAVQ